VRRFGTLLDQRVQRHDIEAAEHPQQHEVGDDAPVRRLAQERFGARRTVRREAAAREIQVDREGGEPDRPEWHQPDLDLVPREPLAQQRADADADREDRKQQRGDVLVAAEDALGVGRELGEVGGAVEPEPRDAEHRQPYHAIAVGKAQIARGLGERIPVDLQIGSHRRSLRYAAARDVARNRDDDGRRPRDERPAGLDGDDEPTDDLAQQDSDEGAHLNQPVAADQLVGPQVLGQDRILHRPEHRRMHAHQRERAEQQRQVAPVEPDRSEHHDADFEQLDDADEGRFLELVRNLARGRGEQHERSDEGRGGDVHQIVGRQRGQRGGLERDEDDQRVLVDVVVAGAEELGPEERRETAFAQELELTVFGHPRCRGRPSRSRIVAFRRAAAEGPRHAPQALCDDC
jgi:hypothetical protein